MWTNQHYCLLVAQETAESTCRLDIDQLFWIISQAVVDPLDDGCQDFWAGELGLTIMRK